MNIHEVIKIIKNKYPTYGSLVKHILKVSEFYCENCKSENCFIVNEKERNTVRCMECDSNFNFLEGSKYHKKNISLMNMFIIEVVYNFCKLNNTTFSIDKLSKAMKLKYSTVYKATNILLENAVANMDNKKVHAHVSKIGLMTNELNNIKIQWSGIKKNG